MILQQLQDYLRDRSQVSLEELHRHFQIDIDALRGMLTPLIRKGRIHKIEAKKCAQCHSCAPESLEMYEWVKLPKTS
jgi:predicted transcriptional regulator